MDKLGSTCQPCSYDCFSCNRLNICLNCSETVDFRQLDNVTLRCLPIPGYYDVNRTMCAKCPNTCSNCISATYCTNCNPGYFLNKNMCISACPAYFFGEKMLSSCQSCPHDCLSCNSMGQCIDCSLTNDFRMLTSKSRCSSILKYYDDGVRVSKPCPSSCSTCISFTFCLTCTKGYFLTLNNIC